MIFFFCYIQCMILWGRGENNNDLNLMFPDRAALRKKKKKKPNSYLKMSILMCFSSSLPTLECKPWKRRERQILGASCLVFFVFFYFCFWFSGGTRPKIRHFVFLMNLQNWRHYWEEAGKQSQTKKQWRVNKNKNTRAETLTVTLLHTMDFTLFFFLCFGVLVNIFFYMWVKNMKLILF